LHGHQIGWDENGQKKGEGEYQHDLQITEWKDWGEHGKPVDEKPR
jgi:antitoxin component YwqK of YwqJK toxin-antitoxin module